MTSSRRAELLRRSADLDEEQARIKRELADLEHRDINPSTIYSTAPGRAHPGSRRWFLERVRKHPRARRLGGKRGRGVVWEIDRADFDSSLAVAASETAPATLESVDSWINNAGYRPTTSTRRTPRGRVTPIRKNEDQTNVVDVDVLAELGLGRAG